jgi:UDP-N-acetylglucosamine:LPS N-acetylglucosamine transferase
VTSHGANPAPLRVCVLGLGGGGHHFQIERLFSALGGNLELVLVYVIDTQVDANWASPAPVRRVFVVRSPLLKGDSLVSQAWRLPLAVARAFVVLAAARPDCMVAVGTAQAIPFACAGWLLGIPLFFVESITRVNAPGRTGRIVSRLGLARKLFYQWPEAAAKDLGSTYAGRVVE